MVENIRNNPENNDVNLFDMLDFMASTMGKFNNYTYDPIGRVNVNGYIVSTIDSPDFGFETAVIGKNKTVVVERYKSEEAAKAGHDRWMEHIKTIDTHEGVMDPITFREIGFSHNGKVMYAGQDIELERDHEQV